MSMIDYSHKNSPGEVVKAVIEYQKLRAEAAGKASLASKEKINYTSEVIDACETIPEVNEIFQLEEDHCYYKRVNKPFGKKVRKFSFKNNYQSRNFQNRQSKNFHHKKRDWRQKNQGKQGFSYSKNQNFANKKSNLLGRARTYLDKHKSNTKNFRTKFDRYKNFVDKNKIFTKKSGQEVVHRQVYDRLNSLIEEMLSEKENDTMDIRMADLWPSGGYVMLH